MTTKVTLRQKKISKGRQSLYLDFYPAIPHPETGKPTRREFLGLYLFDKAKNPIDKQGNKETLQLAEQIRQKRENHLNKPEIYTGYEKEQLKIKERGEQNFVAYFKTLADKRKASNHACLIHIQGIQEKVAARLNETFPLSSVPVRSSSCRTVPEGTLVTAMIHNLLLIYWGGPPTGGDPPGFSHPRQLVNCLTYK